MSIKSPLEERVIVGRKQVDAFRNRRGSASSNKTEQRAKRTGLVRGGDFRFEREHDRAKVFRLQEAQGGSPNIIGGALELLLFHFAKP